MWAGTREMGRLIALRWPELAASGGFAGALWLLGFRMHLRTGHRQRERQIAEEMEAYARLNVKLGDGGDAGELAGTVSRLVAEKSAFGRAAMLVRDAEGRLTTAGSAGMDDSTRVLLNAWGEGVVEEERGGMGVRVGARSFAVVLGTMPAEVGYRRAIVVPLWTSGDRVLGVLAVGADGVMGVRRSALAKALEPLEALAFKLERAMEKASVTERLARAEKLAGLGLLASGMAHALNNPLTAVLGFAELIANTTGESRVKEDAEIIVREALRMRETVEKVLEFGRPAGRGEELVDVSKMVRELAEACVGKLENRGVLLVVEADDGAALVRGDRSRLRQMMEHLLNNAAQALADVAESDEERMIRISLDRDGAAVHVIVSDTGPGFREPGRVFELGASTKGAGLGLSVCYGIAHEHGGEIRAFNLHPHGAAVAVELPVGDFAIKKSERAAGGRTRSVSV
jgi:signal transduction histidine kinase